MTQYCFLEPLDLLFLRGNKLFGDPGSYGESLVPPWPSVVAGALRSRMLVDDGVNLAAFADNKDPHPTLGTPRDPGSFRVVAFGLARREGNRFGTLHAVPADLVVSKSKADESIRVTRMTPRVPAAGLLCSLPSSLIKMPVLAQEHRMKAESGYWLNSQGWCAYLNDRPLTDAHLCKSSDLWVLDLRVGVGLNAQTRSAEDGKLFTSQAVALKNDMGFLVGVEGVDKLPNEGTVRLGGDGRAAAVHPAREFEPVEPDYMSICRKRACRVVLTSPGLFPEGWKLPGVEAGSSWCLGDISAKLVAAAVPRAEIISGWDLASRQPKPAERVAPTGSVFWLEDLEATPDALRTLVDSGLWLSRADNPVRRAEGFNRFAFAAY